MEHSKNRMEGHLTLVAVLNIAFGIVEFLIALVVLAGTIAGSMLADDPEASRIIPFAGSALFLFLILTSIPEIVAGIGLLKRKPWARILILIIACLDLLWFPVGTVIGIYEFWVMLQEDTVRLLGPPPNPSPPSPLPLS
jgi:hypothetical protein